MEVDERRSARWNLKGISSDSAGESTRSGELIVVYRSRSGR